MYWFDSEVAEQKRVYCSHLVLTLLTILFVVKRKCSIQHRTGAIETGNSSCVINEMWIVSVMAVLYRMSQTHLGG